MEQAGRLGRRGLLQASLAGALAGCSTMPGSSFEPAPQLAPIRARTDRIFDIAVCLRAVPSRRPARGDRTAGQHAGGAQLRPRRQRLVAVVGLQRPRRAPGHAGRSCRVAVIGCGALGLTSAILSQRAGARVTIYARDQLPGDDVGPGDRRMDAQFAHCPRPCRQAANFEDRVGGDGARRLQDAPRYLGPAGARRWNGSTSTRFPTTRHAAAATTGSTAPAKPAVEFASYARRIRDLTPRLATACRPMPRRSRRQSVARSEIMVFNIADLRPHPDERLLRSLAASSGAPEFQAPRADRRPAPEGRHQLHRLRGASAVEGRDAGARAWPDRAPDPAARGALWPGLPPVS